MRSLRHLYGSQSEFWPDYSEAQVDETVGATHVVTRMVWVRAVGMHKPTPLRADGVSLVVIYGRIMKGRVSADGTFVYLFIYFKSNIVPHTRCELRLAIYINPHRRKRTVLVWSL